MRRLVVFTLAVGAVVAACYPVEAPAGGVASVSSVLPPWPAVVVGDTMRDSAGNVAPLRALAFGSHGDTLALQPRFVLLDGGAHLAGAGNLLVGDSLRGAAPVRVVGSLGSLQTPPQNVYVTVAPRRLVAITHTDSITHQTDSALVFLPTPDTLSSSNQLTLSLSVVGGAGADTTVPGWVVWYQIIHAPDSTGSAPAVFVADNQQHVATADTTTTAGQTSRRIQLAFTRLADTALVVGHRTDSVIVKVSATYKGAQLSGSPVLYVIPIKFKGFSTP